jgi:hypothetical protein
MGTRSLLWTVWEPEAARTGGQPTAAVHEQRTQLFVSYLKYMKRIINLRNLVNKAAEQTGTTVRARVFKFRTAGWKSVCIRKVCGRPNRSTFSVVFLGPRANSEFVPKFHVALHASHADLPIPMSKFRPKIALTSTPNFT